MIFNTIGPQDQTSKKGRRGHEQIAGHGCQDPCRICVITLRYSAKSIGHLGHYRRARSTYNTNVVQDLAADLVPSGPEEILILVGDVAPANPQKQDSRLEAEKHLRFFSALIFQGHKPLTMAAEVIL